MTHLGRRPPRRRADKGSTARVPRREALVARALGAVACGKTGTDELVVSTSQGELAVDITVDTPDGEVFKAVWFGTANAGAPVVILAHMRGQGRRRGSRLPSASSPRVTRRSPSTSGATAGPPASAAQEDLAGVASVSAPVTFEGLDAETAAAEITEAYLAVAASDDQPYSDDALALADAAGVERVSLPGSAHGTDLLDDPDAAPAEALLGFLADLLP